MNKHLIILPLLLVSAVSLHALSFYLEEPEEIAQNPIPVESTKPIESSNQVQSTQPTSDTSSKKPESVLPSLAQTTKPEITTTVQPSATSVKQTTSSPNNVVKNTPQPQQSKTLASIKPSALPSSPSQKPLPVTLPSQKSLPVASPSITNTQQIATVNYIKPKPISEIVKEAKLVGGRLDPFLAIKPPDMEKVPEVPDSLKQSYNDAKKAKQPEAVQTPLKNGTETIPKPPTFLPVEKEVKKTSNNTKHKGTKKPSGTDNIIKNEYNTPPVNNEPSGVIIELKKRINEDIIVTGIVKGSKPLVLLSIKGKETKVVAQGEEIYKVNGRSVKIVAIKFNDQSITVTDGKSSVALKIKEDSEDKSSN